MIDLYIANTFNGQRVSIMLEEITLPYFTHHLNLTKGDQHQAKFLRLNPSGRIPVIVDNDSELKAPLVVTQSTAILQYLAEKSGQLLPQSLPDRAKVYEWMHFHAIDIGSVKFSAFYLQNHCSPKQNDAATQLQKRIYALYRHFDEQLMKHEYLAGDFYSIADITTLPAVISDAKLTDYANISRWATQLKQRPAVQKGLAAAISESNHED